MIRSVVILSWISTLDVGDWIPLKPVLGVRVALHILILLITWLNQSINLVVPLPLSDLICLRVLRYLHTRDKIMFLFSETRCRTTKRRSSRSHWAATKKHNNPFKMCPAVDSPRFIRFIDNWPFRRFEIALSFITVLNVRWIVRAKQWHFYYNTINNVTFWRKLFSIKT